MWPSYSRPLISDVKGTLEDGGPLSGYRSNKAWGVPPREESWAAIFERELEDRFRVKHAIAVNSGTMALTAAIFALDLPPSSDIVTTPYSFSATPASIILAGHRPVFADVDSETFNITTETVKKVLTKRTRAILPVDLFGRLADYDGLEDFGVPVIRDGCQSVGASIKGVFHFGAVTCASGNGTKNLPIGEGGWCLTDDPKLAERIRLYISHAENFGTDWVGVNGRMPELTACVGYHGLQELMDRNAVRIELAYQFKLEAMSMLAVDRDPDDWLYLPAIMPNGHSSHVFYVFPFKFNSKKRSRKQFVEACQRKKVAISGGYITPTLEKYHAFRKYCKRPLPVVTELSEKTLCLISDFTPDKPLKHAEDTARKIAEVLRA